MKYALLLLAFALPCHAEGLNLDPWTREDSYREAAVAVLWLADWSQTRYIQKHPDKFSEANPHLSSEPSLGQVNRFFLEEAAIHIAVLAILPSAWRPAFQYVAIGYKFAAVEHNFSAGVRFSF